jgi:putative glycerol-1-phosphate prenyltransferase
MLSSRLLVDLQARKRNRQPAFAVLIDPDKTTPEEAPQLAAAAVSSGVDYLLVGGSLVTATHIEALVLALKQHCSLPVILFPGSPAQVTPAADALLYLSLVSGRNPEMLIGQHVLSAPVVRASGLEILSTGYLVVDGGRPTTVSYMSGAAPLPADKPDIALCTAWASELLGHHLLYLDAGSGAQNPVSEKMIRKIAGNTANPLFVGGGIRTPLGAHAAAAAGATVVVVGNALEQEPERMAELAEAVHSACTPTHTKSGTENFLKS